MYFIKSTKSQARLQKARRDYKKPGETTKNQARQMFTSFISNNIRPIVSIF